MNSFSGGNEKKGTIAAFAAFFLWGFMPLYWRLLSSVPAFEIVNQRVLWSFLFVLGYLLVTGGLGNTLRIFRQPKSFFTLLASGLLLAANWLLYIWAVNSNQVLAASLGYYINPLINILMGRIFFGDKLSSLAWIAIACAFSGVAYQIYSLGSLPLVSLGLGLSFAIYGLLRKIVLVEALPGLFVENLLLLPVALGFIAWMHVTGSSNLATQGDTTLWACIILLGPLTTLPLLWFTYAARNIPLTTLGLLQYLSPSMSFLLGVFVFHEPFTMDSLATFLCIWTGLALYSWDNIRKHNMKKSCKMTSRETLIK